jgi:hypothetical protein
VHSRVTVATALDLATSGLGASEIARRLGIPRSTVRGWLGGAIPVRRLDDCHRCRADRDLSALPGEYVYLLGLYLGDGCISSHSRGVYRLRIVLDEKYPGIIRAASGAIETVRDGAVLVQRRRDNCVEVSAYWQHWPCLFPQHGRGKKHERRIVLEHWQEGLSQRWPGQLLRGLIDSDGCRFQNTGRRWSWPRYSFDNHSAEIRAIFCRACDHTGVRWTESGRHTIYVSRKVDVAILDQFIGPKH